MYAKFLIRFILASALLVVCLQAVFIYTSINNVRRGVDEVDFQILTAFKSAARTCQWSVQDAPDDFSAGVSGKYQLAPGNGDFYKFYYTRVGSDIDPTPEYERYREMINANFTIDSTPLYTAIDMEELGFVPMDFALPYIQLLPISGATLAGPESVQLVQQDGTPITQSFDSDLVSQTRKILLQTLSENFKDTSHSNNNSSNWVNFTDSSDTGSGAPHTDGLPNIKMTLMYSSGRDPVTSEPNLHPVNSESDLDNILKFTSNNHTSVRAKLGPVQRDNEPANHMLDQAFTTAYYDLYLKAEFTTVTPLFAFTPDHDVFSIRVPQTKYYHITYSLLN